MDELGAVNSDRSRLYAARDRLVCELKVAGVPRAELAALIGASVDMVKGIIAKGIPTGGNGSA